MTMLSERQACDLLEIKPYPMWCLLDSGEIPAVEVGATVRPNGSIRRVYEVDELDLIAYYARTAVVAATGWTFSLPREVTGHDTDPTRAVRPRSPSRIDAVRQVREWLARRGYPDKDWCPPGCDWEGGLT